jgi:hypothetical protein
MNESPSINITFDPITLQITDIKFATANDQECEKLREILREGIRAEGEKESGAAQ